MHIGRCCCSVYDTLSGNMQTCDSSTVAAIAYVKYRVATWEILSCHALCETQVAMQHVIAESMLGSVQSFQCTELSMP